MFPIANDQGRAIAFTGRTLATGEKAGPKYLNSPETPIYSKSRVLFNLDLAKEAIRKLDYAILVEGQMDCIAVYAADLAQGETCAERREAVRRLAATGDARAAATLRRALARRGPRGAEEPNACIDQDIRSALSALEK
jgi:hypothetical protein